MIKIKRNKGIDKIKYSLCIYPEKIEDYDLIIGISRNISIIHGMKNDKYYIIINDLEKCSLNDSNFQILFKYLIVNNIRGNISIGLFTNYDHSAFTIPTKISKVSYLLNYIVGCSVYAPLL